jgi:hypothetical protein
MPIGSGDFGEAVNPGIHHYYGLAYTQHKTQYTEIFQMLTSKRNKEEALSVTGFGLVPQKSKGQSVSYETTSENWIGTHVHITYGLGFIVERELAEDELYGIINRLPGALARSVNQTIETTSANILNNAFDSTVATGADGLELCSDAHLKGGGGTWSNEPSVAADLDSTSLEQAFIDINDIPDDKGLRNALKSKKMFVAEENRVQAAKVLGSNKVPEDANNAINPLMGILPYSVNAWLTDPDAWFITTDAPYGLVFYWRRKPEFTKDNDFDTENAKWKTTFRFSVGWDDARGIYGSPGV